MFVYILYHTFGSLSRGFSKLFEEFFGFRVLSSVCNHFSVWQRFIYPPLDYIYIIPPNAQKVNMECCTNFSRLFCATCSAPGPRMAKRGSFLPHAALTDGVHYGRLRLHRPRRDLPQHPRHIRQSVRWHIPRHTHRPRLRHIPSV